MIYTSKEAGTSGTIFPLGLGLADLTQPGARTRAVPKKKIFDSSSSKALLLFPALFDPQTQFFGADSAGVPAPQINGQAPGCGYDQPPPGSSAALIRPGRRADRSFGLCGPAPEAAGPPPS